MASEAAAVEAATVSALLLSLYYVNVKATSGGGRKMKRIFRLSRLLGGLQAQQVESNNFITKI